MTQSYEPRLAEVLEWAWTAAPPAEVREKARLLFLDTVGCVLAASRKPRIQAWAAQLARAEPGPARVPGFAQGFSTGAAAALFCTSACWDEACEGLARAHGRPGMPVMAAAWALAQVLGKTFGEFLDAVLAGYEAGGRLGEAVRIGPGMHVDATWPSFGAAVAVVRLSGGTAAQALDAVRSVACQMPRSLYLAAKTGAEIRNTYLSHAAQLGLLAGNGAMAGLTSPEGALDELEPVTLLGPGTWVMMEGYLKPFAAVRHAHYGAQAALDLRPALEGKLDAISAIVLSTYREALTYCGNRAPKQPIQAQFSLSYAVAAALATGDVGPEAYAMGDPRIDGLEAKVVLAEDEALTRDGRRGASLRVTAGGKTVEATVGRVIGDPGLPMTREEVLRKFRRYTGTDGTAMLDTPGHTPVSGLLR